MAKGIVGGLADIVQGLSESTVGVTAIQTLLGTGAVWGGAELLKAGGIIKTIAAQFGGIAGSAGSASGILGILGSVTLPKILAVVAAIVAAWKGIDWAADYFSVEGYGKRAEEASKNAEDLKNQQQSLNEEFADLESRYDSLSKTEKARYDYLKENGQAIQEEVLEAENNAVAKNQKAWNARSREIYRSFYGHDTARQLDYFQYAMENGTESIEDQRKALQKYKNAWKPVRDEINANVEAGRKLTKNDKLFLEDWNRFLEIEAAFNADNPTVVDNIKKTTDSISEQAENVVYLQNRYAELSEFLSTFGQGVNGSDLLKGMQDAYSTFLADFNAGKYGTVEYKSFIDTFMPEDVFDALGGDYVKAGQYLAGQTVDGYHSEINNLLTSQNPLQAFIDLIKSRGGELKTASGDLAAYIAEDGTLVVESWDAVGEAIGVAKAGVQGLRAGMQDFSADVILSTEEVESVLANLGKSLQEASVGEIVNAVKVTFPDATPEEVANIVTQLTEAEGIEIDPIELKATIDDQATSVLEDLEKKSGKSIPVTVNVTDNGTAGVVEANIKLVTDKDGSVVGVSVTDSDTAAGVLSNITLITDKNGEVVGINVNDTGDASQRVEAILDADGNTVGVTITDNATGESVQLTLDDINKAGTTITNTPVSVSITAPNADSVINNLDKIGRAADTALDKINNLLEVSGKSFGDFGAGESPIMSSGIEEAGKVIGELAGSYKDATEAAEEYAKQQNLSAKETQLVIDTAKSASSTFNDPSSRSIFNTPIMVSGEITSVTVPEGQEPEIDVKGNLELGDGLGTDGLGGETETTVTADTSQAQEALNDFNAEKEEAAEPVTAEVGANLDTLQESIDKIVEFLDRKEEIPETKSMTVNAHTEEASAALSEVVGYIGSIQNKSVTITVTTIYNTVGKMGTIPGRASGVKNSPAGLALVNDGNPVNGSAAELIVQDGQAFIAGGGEETLVNLKQGATVYTAKETQDILRNSNNRGIGTLLNAGVNAYAEGTHIDTSRWSSAGSGSVGDISVPKATASSKSSSSSSSKDPWKEEFENWLKAKKHALAMDEITEKQYYDDLEVMYKQYFSDLSKYQEEYWKYEEEIYRYRKQELEDTIKLENSLNELAKAKTQKVLVYKDGKFQYIQNVEAIAKAQQEVNAIQGYADGTTNAKAGLDLVGENGPELRVLGQGTGIIPADLTRNLMKLGSMSVGSLAGFGSNSTDIFNIGEVKLENVNNVEDIFNGLKNYALQRSASRI